MQRGGGRFIWVIVAVGLGILRFAISGSSHRSYYPPPTLNLPSLPAYTPPPAWPTLPSAPNASDEEPVKVGGGLGEDAHALNFGLTSEVMPGGKRLRLTAGGGSAVLELGDVESRGSLFAFGKARWVPGDRAEGEKFAAAVAKWLKVKLPPGKAGTLEPFPISYVQLGNDERWQANKLFFEVGSQYAEVFFNVAADGSRAQFSEKDEEYRKDLVSLLARILRDGAPPRRTPETDATLGSAEPLFAAMKPVPGSDYVTAGAWVKSSWVAARQSLGRSTVLVWSDLSAMPRELGSIDGRVAAIAPSPSGDQVALTVVHPKMRGSWASDDPGSIYLVAMSGGEPKELVKTSEEFHFYGGAAVKWSADGTQFSIDGTPAKGKVVLRTYDATTGAVISNGPYKRAVAVSESPDGQYKFTVGKSALDVRGPAGALKWVPAAPEKSALSGLRDEPRFVGPHSVVVYGEEPMALDLASCKVRYLFAKRGPRLDSASPDGALALVRDGEQLYVARAQ